MRHVSFVLLFINFFIFENTGKIKKKRPDPARYSPWQHEKVLQCCTYDCSRGNGLQPLGPSASRSHWTGGPLSLKQAEAFPTPDSPTCRFPSHPPYHKKGGFDTNVQRKFGQTSTHVCSNFYYDMIRKRSTTKLQSAHGDCSRDNLIAHAVIVPVSYINTIRTFSRHFNYVQPLMGATPEMRVSYPSRLECRGEK